MTNHISFDVITCVENGLIYIVKVVSLYKKNQNQNLVNGFQHLIQNTQVPKWNSKDKLMNILYYRVTTMSKFIFAEKYVFAKTSYLLIQWFNWLLVINMLMINIKYSNSICNVETEFVFTEFVLHKNVSFYYNEVRG